MADHERDAGLPIFDDRAQRWFERRLKAELPVRWKVGSDAARLSHLVRWYSERWEQHVRWKDHETYHGSAYSVGAWVIDWERVKASMDGSDGPWEAATRSLKAETEAASLALDAERFPTLDAWLEAERTGQLSHKGAAEPMGRDVLPKSAEDEFFDRRNRVHHTWPKRCTSCDEMFKPSHKTRVRCEACIAAAKAAKKPAVDAAPGQPAGLADAAKTSKRQPRDVVPSAYLTDYEQGYERGMAEFRPMLEASRKLLERSRKMVEQHRRLSGPES